ncbi:MAG: XdhC family protein [Rhodospirillaceae bacterium]
MSAAPPSLDTTTDPHRQAQLWLEEGRKVALATVVETWGSSPRPAGSALAIDGEGAFVGSVSGGCIEGAVIREAFEVMEDGSPRLLDFAVSSEQAWEVGLSCGGRVQVLVEKVGAAPDAKDA